MAPRQPVDTLSDLSATDREGSWPMLKGFRDFILRGNVVDLAVAVVMGAAFKTVIDSIVKNVMTPLIGLAGGIADFSLIRTGPLMWGVLINDILSFVIIGTIVYFVVVLPL